MCGICGILCRGNPVEAAAAGTSFVREMCESLRARGPDGEGVLHSPPIVLGHRRLSVLDLSESGAQPMRLGADGPIITYNGEVYNCDELRASLQAEGDSDWRGHSDTEVILHAYRSWGLKGLRRLEGIFSLALWDPRCRRLVLMRDRLGVKPLFYCESSVGLAFASEIRALRELPGVDGGIDQQALREYLWFGAAMEDRTFYSGIRQLKPGHLLVSEDGEVVTMPWFRLEEWLGVPAQACSFGEASSLVRTAMDRAVARQLVADVPVAMFLSGGIDSSAIAASAGSHGGLSCAFAASFGDQAAIDEYPKAKLVADGLHLPIERLHINVGDLWPALDALTQAHGEPFSDAANIPVYLMAKALRGRYKVALVGDGGDELFAGYRRHSVLGHADAWRMLPPLLVRATRAFGGPGRRFARVAESVACADPAMRMSALLTPERIEDPPEALFSAESGRELAAATDPFLAYRNAALRFDHPDAVQQMLLADLTVLLPSVFLAKVDRATMAAGVEARVPLLDELLVRPVVGMPTRWKVRGFQRKRILRAALRGRLPAAVLDAPKSGFGVPYARWLQGSLRAGTRERVLDPSFRRKFGVAEDRVQRLLEPDAVLGHRDALRLWKLLMLALWAR